MPCIQITTAKPITAAQEQAVKAELGKAIELLPRKSEKWLMCVFRSDASVWFQGEQADAALVEVDVFGTLEKEPCDALTVAIMKIMEAELSIAPDKLYNCCQVYGENHVRLITLNAGVPYWFAVDAFNENGITPGPVFAMDSRG